MSKRCPLEKLPSTSRVATPVRVPPPYSSDLKTVTTLTATGFSWSWTTNNNRATGSTVDRVLPISIVYRSLRTSRRMVGLVTPVIVISPGDGLVGTTSTHEVVPPLVCDQSRGSAGSSTISVMASKRTGQKNADGIVTETNGQRSLCSSTGIPPGTQSASPPRRVGSLTVSSGRSISSLPQRTLRGREYRRRLRSARFLSSGSSTTNLTIRTTQHVVLTVRSRPSIP